MKQLLSIIFILLCFNLIFSQARLNLNNDVYMVMNNNVYLVIENNNPNAISTLGTGGNIVSEAEFNKIKWNIGTSTGTYTIPYTDNVGTGAGFGNNAQTVDAGLKIPYSLTINTAGSGLGFIEFSTYDGVSWDNETYMPSMVTHMGQYNAPGIANNSAAVIDRFWMVNALNYTTKPNVTHTFTYIDDEHTATGNTLLEPNLGAQRFNDPAGLWGDMLPIVASLNMGTNVLITPVVNPTDFFAAWTLSDIINPLPVELTEFNATCASDRTVNLAWSTASEINSNYFSIEKSIDGINFTLIGTVQGAGNSTNLLNYSFIDVNGDNLAYYRLKLVDFDGTYTYSNLIPVSCDFVETEIYAYEDNVGMNLVIRSVSNENVNIKVVDATGRVIFSTTKHLTKGVNTYKIEDMIASGIYFISVRGELTQEAIKVFKR